MKHLKLLLAGVLLMIMTASCSKSAETQIMENLNLGQKYLAELNYEEAIVAFSTVIQLEDKNLEAYQGLAEAYQKSGRHQEAADTLEKGYVAAQETEKLVEEIKSQMLAVYGEWGRSAREAGDDESVILIYSRLIELEPSHADYYLELAEQYLEAGDVDKALEILEDGEERTGDERITQKIKETKGQQERTDTDAQIPEEYEYILNKLLALYKAEEWKAMGEYMFTDEYGLFCDSINQPLIYQDTDGLNIGIMEEGLYFGEVNQGVLEGNGMWIFSLRSVRSGKISTDRFTGTWVDGYPNGAGEFASGDNFRVTGTYKDGYEDGDMVMYETYRDGSSVAHYRSEYGVPVKIADIPDDQETYVFAYGSDGSEKSIEYGRKYGVWGFMKGDEFNPDWGY